MPLVFLMLIIEIILDQLGINVFYTPLQCHKVVINPQQIIIVHLSDLLSLHDVVMQTSMLSVRFGAFAFFMSN
ncbi:hypothetical protein KIN20_007318 [Parelaphostrongylus tenuis]|uniref:Secreted protein n=1 Tax=Parelaphostrongylus tenuis TaxID=148309 RepID=A0AAD5M372_PARTN|nr:hypothetical protein KIN20_007318 [Parelaphostrongylus tenuis]